MIGVLAKNDKLNPSANLVAGDTTVGSRPIRANVFYASLSVGKLPLKPDRADTPPLPAGGVGELQNRIAAFVPRPDRRLRIEGEAGRLEFPDDAIAQRAVLAVKTAATAVASALSTLR